MSVSVLRGWTSSIRKPSVLPGFGLTFGFAVTYLSLIVLIPLAVLVWRASELGVDGIWRVATTPRVMAALQVSFFTSAAAALINAVFGVIVAWVLVRYDFPGKRLLDAAVDLPFALPTAVAGIALAALYAPNGWIGSLFAPWGIKIAFTPYGILIALIFVGLPFIVRTVQPVLEDFDRLPHHAARPLARDPDRNCNGLRACCGRIRLGDLHRRQHAVHFRNRTPPDRQQARGVRLCGRGRHCDRDAGHLVCLAARHQRRAGLQPMEARRCVTVARPENRGRHAGH
jgi:hypothetical protein